MRTLKRMILYGGLEKKVYMSHRDELLKHDIKNVTIYYIVGGIGFLLLTIASLLSNGFAHVNVLIYSMTALSFWVVYLLMRLTIKIGGEASRYNQIYIYLFMAVLYMESIALTLQHGDMPAVTYIGVLLILPLLFAQPPVLMGIFQAVFVIIFCLFVRQYKLPEVVPVDIWNGISFLAVSLLVIVIIIPIRIRLLIQHEEIKKLSETDLLTGLRNRNSFELDIQLMKDMDCRPICLYADANGLHEINNKFGHKAGDDMLKAVADEIRKAFGERYTYRVGGDEFVAFVFDEDIAFFERQLSLIKSSVEKQGYHISYGYALPDSQTMDIDLLVKNAESQMFVDKADYYRIKGNDRRSR